MVYASFLLGLLARRAYRFLPDPSLKESISVPAINGKEDESIRVTVSSINETDVSNGLVTARLNKETKIGIDTRNTSDVDQGFAEGNGYIVNQGYTLDETR